MATAQLTCNPEFKNAQREHHSFLAEAEKRALICIAERLPGWVTSDQLTGLGFAAMICAGASYWAARWNHAGWIAVIFLLAVNWFGDSLDGTLARVRDRQRPRYGFYIDHMIDALGMTVLFCGLAASGYMSWLPMMVFLIAYFVLCIEVYLATYTLGRFQLSFVGFGPTELRFVLAMGTATLFFRPTVHVLGSEYLLFDVGGVVAALGITAVLAVATIQHTRELAEQEQLPSTESATHDGR